MSGVLTGLSASPHSLADHQSSDWDLYAGLERVRLNVSTVRERLQAEIRSASVSPSLQKSCSHNISHPSRSSNTRQQIIDDKCKLSYSRCIYRLGGCGAECFDIDMFNRDVELYM